MTDEKWNNFMMSGKISDYLDYKKSEAKVGENVGNSNVQGDSPQGISCR